MALEPDRPVEEDEIKRWPLNTPIQIYLRENLPHLAGHSKDISLEGIQIDIGIKLPLRSVVTLEVYFQRSNVFDFIDQEPLRVKAQVKWRRQSNEEDYDSWETGLRFINITEEQRSAILDEVGMLDVLA